MTAFDVDIQRLRSGYGVKWGALDPGTLGAWVADMDFPVAPVIRRRLHEVTDHGYPHWPGGDPVVAAFTSRMATRHGWTPSHDRTRVFTDLIQILQVMIETVTSPGDGIGVQLPNYPPFLASITRAGRRIVPVSSPGDLAGCRLFLLVNPHNPTGRVFPADELAAFASAAQEHDVTVLSDEIHADLVYAGHRHVPFASVSPDAAARTITATSATKAFNIAGLRCAVAHIGPAAVWDALDRFPLDYFGQPSTLGRVATVAAWREADDWLDGLMSVLTANRDQVTRWAATLPGDTGYREPEGTYLAWLRFPELGPDPAGVLEERARVRLGRGADFSPETGAYVRINFATSPEILTEILTRVSRVVTSSRSR
ncbi:putative aminotransferase [Actinoplanes missouriensis 431]|uniref:cysteine-S-conjugate beta-lyase n=1 Tax=Actinoplanes missouriensis (strain ATCC 14538 / DSM 43046 / CBS 188.64 / JCM 3121 / NBRC 102363 / NCIMB 12654 / NRRL B-3342 / UNCC 431) TaxID=512565 RepID=I0H9U7_ACTM4|nr:aminotransferase class I/II-fold pyridoxal phosphate-dependent enzyme [Actinoplanes missouriensis]BAL89784.1 putative aminotransferase [Actinoplanes missouriensis 431]